MRNLRRCVDVQSLRDSRPVGERQAFTMVNKQRNLKKEIDRPDIKKPHNGAGSEAEPDKPRAFLNDRKGLRRGRSCLRHEGPAVRAIQPA